MVSTAASALRAVSCLATGEQQPKPAGTHVVIAADEVIASGEHVVRAEYREQ